MHAARTVALAVAALISTACASTGTPNVLRLSDGERRSHGNGDYISFREVARERASTAWDLVERLRPYYLRGRNVGFYSAPIVYFDDMMLGDVSELRTIAAGDVFEIRYVKGDEMRSRWSEASGHQVIQVVSRR